MREQAFDAEFYFAVGEQLTERAQPQLRQGVGFKGDVIGSFKDFDDMEAEWRLHRIAHLPRFQRKGR